MRRARIAIPFSRYRDGALTLVEPADRTRRSEEVAFRLVSMSGLVHEEDAPSGARSTTMPVRYPVRGTT